MKGLGKIIGRMARNRKQWEGLMGLSNAARPAFDAPAGTPSRLEEMTGFGTNPGNLRMLTYVPPNVPRSPALVVVLHGCTQDAAGYVNGVAWSSLAVRYGFVLLII